MTRPTRFSTTNHSSLRAHTLLSFAPRQAPIRVPRQNFIPPNQCLQSCLRLQRLGSLRHTRTLTTVLHILHQSYALIVQPSFPHSAFDQQITSMPQFMRCTSAPQYVLSLLCADARNILHCCVPHQPATTCRNYLR